MRQPSSGNPSNNPFLDATMQLPQLRERSPATPGHTICCPAPRHCLSEHVSVPEGMCQVSGTNAVVPSCTALKRISPGNDWWFCCSPPTATAPQACQAQLHCSACSPQQWHKHLPHLHPGHNLHNPSFPLLIQGCRLGHSSPTLYLPYLLMYK